MKYLVKVSLDDKEWVDLKILAESLIEKGDKQQTYLRWLEEASKPTVAWAPEWNDPIPDFITGNYGKN